jgi:hypothetical protein
MNRVSFCHDGSRTAAGPRQDGKQSVGNRDAMAW